MAYDWKILHDVKGVKKFTFFDDDECGVRYEALTGIGRVSGAMYTFHAGRHGVVAMDRDVAPGMRMCDDTQLVATYMSGLPLDSLAWEKFTPGDVKVLSKEEAWDYIIKHNVPHPGTPI